MSWGYSTDLGDRLPFLAVLLKDLNRWDVSWGLDKKFKEEQK
jgi:hypothetical protein